MRLRHLAYLVSWGSLFWLDACSSSKGRVDGGAGGTPVATGGAGGGSGGTGGGPPTGGSGGAGGGSGGAGGGSGGAGGGAPAIDAAPRDAGRDLAAALDGPRDAPTAMGRFSFFVTSLEAMRRLSGNQNGFGGNLRHGEATGLAGADKICTETAEVSMPGSGAKGWKAFLSAPASGGNPAVNAADRIGNGPWYDRRERLVAMTKADLFFPRPRGADPTIINDLPNEYGIPNHRPDPGQPAVDNHHVLTGSDAQGRLVAGNSTCNGWTSVDRTAGRPQCGFSWPMDTRIHWIEGIDEAGCGAGIDIDGGGGPVLGNPVVGSGGGYGGIYCFASSP